MGEPLLVAVLAAGRGSRFGGGKLDAECAGKRLGQWALDAVAAAGLPPGVIVVPPTAPVFAQGSGWDLLANPQAEEGLGTSVAVAAGEARRRGAAGLLVLLADMPLVDPGYLRRLAGAPMPAATRHAGDRAGVPALLGPGQYAALEALTGDRGAAAVLAGYPGLSLLDPLPGMLADVDRPEDLAPAISRLRAP